MLWQVYEAIQEELADGGRAYIICPLVGESTAKGFADTKVANLRCLSIHPLPISRQLFLPAAAASGSEACKLQ